MRAVTDGKLELTSAVSRHLDLCLDCRSCETACPSGVQYGRLIEPFRVAMRESENEQVVDQTPGWFRRFILYGIFPYPKRLKFALFPAVLLQKLKLDRLMISTGLVKLLPGPLKRMTRLLPKVVSAPKFPQVLPAIGSQRARVALFTGCVAEALFGPTNWATARVLQQNGCEVVIPPNQACCGAIHYHSGAGEPAYELAMQNVTAFSSEEFDAVVVNVAGCGSMLKDYGHLGEEIDSAESEQKQQLSQLACRVKDVSEFLAELGPIPPKGQIKLRAAYHDACHLAHAQGIREEPARTSLVDSRIGIGFGR